MENLNDLFSVDLNTKSDFLEEKKSMKSDGVYKIDLTKVKDKKRGYRSVLRFLPNLTKEMTFGQNGIPKISHYVNIKNVRELSGSFDSPKNFDEDCALSQLYYTMSKSSNAIQVDRSKCLQFSKKYYSYVLILEDEQQPELVGKIMVYQYGKSIHEKILAEKNGDITGTECNIFDWVGGKDFVLIGKEINTGEITYPDYKNSMFKQEITSLPVFNKEKNVFKNVPLIDSVDKDGKAIKAIDPRFQKIVVDFLLDREHDLEEYAPKKLTDEQRTKIAEISAFLTGNASASFSANAPKASSDDFDLEETISAPQADAFSTTSTDFVDDDSDFFGDM